MSRFQFVEDSHTTHGVKRLCEVLGLNRSSFYKWRAGRATRATRHRADKALVGRMRDYRLFGFRCGALSWNLITGGEEK